MEGCVARYIGQIWWCTTLKETVDDIKMPERARGASSDPLRAEDGKRKKPDLEGCFGSCYVGSTPLTNVLDW